LNEVAPLDWADFLLRWVDGHDKVDTAAGLVGHGWRLVYSDKPSSAYEQNEAEMGVADLSYSIGLSVADGGMVKSVVWEGPAFRASLAPQARIVGVGDRPFSRANLLAAVRGAGSTPVLLTWDQNGRRTRRQLDYSGTLRYPQLQRIPGQVDALSALLDAR